MPGAGVGSNQQNDALTAARLLTTSIDTHLLLSALQRSGVSLAGAQEFSQGQPVTNAADRRTLAAMLTVLFKSPPASR
jgi:hypothetical protein